MTTQNNDESRGNGHVREEDKNAKITPFKFLLKTVQMSYCICAIGDKVEGKKTVSTPGRPQASENREKGSESRSAPGGAQTLSEPAEGQGWISGERAGGVSSREEDGIGGAEGGRRTSQGWEHRGQMRRTANGTCAQVPGGRKRCEQDMVMEKEFRTRHRGQSTPKTPGPTLARHGALQGCVPEATIPASDWYESYVYGANAEVLF